jgi:DNA-binding NtrC family response regulator
MEPHVHKVLIVEDIQDWRLTLSGVLQEGGFTVDAVGSGDEARKALRNNEYDIALLDIRLDESNESNDEGLVLAEEINRTWPQIKVFITTGYANEEYVRRAMEPRNVGRKRLAINFIKKSDMDELVRIMKQAIG